MPKIKSQWIGKYVFLLFLFLSSGVLSAQSSLSGKIVDEQGEPLENIQVLVQYQPKGGIVAFGISNSKGEYQIQFRTDKDSVYLTTQSLNYSNRQVKISAQGGAYNFRLQPDIKQIREVKVKAPGITRRGDTISYSVGAFASKKDQVIADVINKMPGLEVEADGRILYQGTPIRKYYIEGLDLLEGRYNLANNNLPAQSVASVQVLQNHEPIKLLRKITATDKASLNIKLRHKVTLTGKAELGAGASPLLWNANITPMLFNKKQQVIASYQANNMGRDLAADIKVFTIEDLLDKVENNNDKQDLLGIKRLSSPNFSSMRYLHNNAHLLSTNYLLKLNKDVQFKINSSYVNDYQNHDGSLYTAYYLGNDTVILSEEIGNRIQNRYLLNDFILTQNAEKSYLKNTLSTKIYWNEQLGKISGNTGNITQDLHNPFRSFSNKLKWIKPLGKRMWQFSSFVSYNKTPQSLRIVPGVFADLLNNGSEVDELVQKADQRLWNLNQSLSLIYRVKRMSFTHKLGYQHQQKNFDTDLWMSREGESQNLGEDYRNRLDFSKDKFYATEQMQYISDRLKIFADLPVRFLHYRIRDDIAQINRNKEAFVYQPSLRVNFSFNAFFEWKNSWKRIDRIDDNSRMNYAYVLENYQNLQKREAVLGRTSGQSMSSVLHYKNPLQSLFMYAGYRYSQNHNDVALYNRIQDDGSMILQWEYYDNNRYTHNLFAQASKYVGSWKTNFTLKGDYLLSRSKMFLNDEFSPLANQSYRFNGKISSDIFSWLNVELKSEWLWLKSEVNRVKSPTVLQQSQRMSTMVFPWEQHYFGATAEYYRNEETQHLFLDFLYRFSFPNKRSKLELRWVNVFNRRSYRTYSVDDYAIIGTSYRLRPSQVQLNFSFSF